MMGKGSGETKTTKKGKNDVDTRRGEERDGEGKGGKILTCSSPIRAVCSHSLVFRKIYF